jgi:hypothetical protein
MYLPTGTPHAARARDSVSLHVTLGINQLTWRTLLDRAVSRALGEVDADSHLPAGHLERPGVLADGLSDRLRELAEALVAVDADEVAGAQVRSFLENRVATPLRGAMLDRMSLDALTAGTPLRRRAGKPCVLQTEGDRLHLLLGDRRVTVPARISDAVEQVRGLEQLTPADLPLDPSSSLVLCRRLVREGLLEVVREEPSHEASRRTVR